jgi:hypothetical protein
MYTPFFEKIAALRAACYFKRMLQAITGFTFFGNNQFLVGWLLITPAISFV